MELLKFCQDEKPEGGLPVWRLNMIHEILFERFHTLSKENREVPLVWSIMHMHTTTQLAKILAIKRNLDPELAGLVSVFHDVYTLLTGRYKDHGVKAEEYIREIVGVYNKECRQVTGTISEENVSVIVEAVADHSDKQNVSENPYTELLRDADSLDAYLNGMKPWEGTGREQRVRAVIKELGLKVQL
jgi:uncharacterized protein